jgi:hypothetical protein
MLGVVRPSMTWLLELKQARVWPDWTLDHDVEIWDRCSRSALSPATADHVGGEPAGHRYRHDGSPNDRDRMRHVVHACNCVDRVAQCRCDEPDHRGVHI